jgi:biopolymer transport protein ExbB
MNGESAVAARCLRVACLLPACTLLATACGRLQYTARSGDTSHQNEDGAITGGADAGGPGGGNDANGSLDAAPASASRRDIWIDTSASGADVAEALTDFPLLVRLTEPEVLSGGGDTGQWLLFTDQSGTPLAHEIEVWKPAAGQGLVWIEVPLIAGNSASNRIQLEYGDPERAALRPARGVFTAAAGHAAVYHFAAAAATSDATTQNPLVDQGSQADPGVIGDGRRFDGIAAYMAAADAPSLEPVNLTISAWVKSLGSQGAYAKLFNKVHPTHPFPSYSLEFRATGDILGFQTARTNNQYVTTETLPGIAAGEWHHLAGVFSSTAGTNTLYLDGVPVAQKTGPAQIEYYTDSPRRLLLGAQEDESATPSSFAAAVLDEARVESVARSAGWLRLAYESQRPGQRTLTIAPP